jgi:hypothetical protein
MMRTIAVHRKRIRGQKENAKTDVMMKSINPAIPKYWSAILAKLTIMRFNRIVFLFKGEGKRKSISGNENTSVLLVVECITVTQVINVRKEKITGFAVSVVNGGGIWGNSKVPRVTRGRPKSTAMKRVGTTTFGVTIALMIVFLRRCIFKYRSAFIKVPP